MHIGHSESSCGWGGQEMRVLDEVAGMLERGHRVTLLCPRGDDNTGDSSRHGEPSAERRCSSVSAAAASSTAEMSSTQARVPTRQV
jgi:hypothetical protein